MKYMMLEKIYKIKGVTGSAKMTLQYVCDCSGSLDTGKFVSLLRMIKCCYRRNILLIQFLLLYVLKNFQGFCYFFFRGIRVKLSKILNLDVLMISLSRVDFCKYIYL